MASFRQLPASAKFLLVTILLNSLTLSIVANALPFLFQDILGVGPQEASFQYGLLLVAYYGTLAFFAPIMGRLSDRWGRKPLIYAALAGGVLDALICAFATTIEVLFFARILSGVCGTIAVISAAFIADVVEPRIRPLAFGMVSAAAGIGLIGYLIGGIFIDIDVRLPFYVASALTAANLVYALVVLPESNVTGQSQKAGGQGKLKLTLILRLFLFIYFFWTLAFVSAQSTMVLTTQIRFGWGGQDVGNFIACFAIVAVLSQMLLPQRLITKFGEARTIAMTMAMLFVSYVLFALSSAPWQMYLVVILGITFGVVSSPVFRAFSSRFVEPTQQGGFQGQIGRAQNLASIAGSFGSASVLSFAGTRFGPVAASAAPFALSALSMAATLVALVIVLAKLRKDTP